MVVGEVGKRGGEFGKRGGEARRLNWAVPPTRGLPSFSVVILNDLLGAEVSEMRGWVQVDAEKRVSVAKRGDLFGSDGS